MNLAAMDPKNYGAQLQQKRIKLEQAFADFNPPALEIFSSETMNYSMRAEFRMWD